MTDLTPEEVRIISESPEMIASRDAAENALAEGRTTPLSEALAKLQEMDDDFSNPLES